jgi:hypothetical protein
VSLTVTLGQPQSVGFGGCGGNITAALYADSTIDVQAGFAPGGTYNLGPYGFGGATETADIAPSVLVEFVGAISGAANNRMSGAVAFQNRDGTLFDTVAITLVKQ